MNALSVILTEYVICVIIVLMCKQLDSSIYM